MAEEWRTDAMITYRHDEAGDATGGVWAELKTSGLWWCFPWGKASALLHVAAVAFLFLVEPGFRYIGTPYAYDAMSWVQVSTPVVASMVINFGIGWFAFHGRRMLVTDESVTLVLRSGREQVFRYADFRTMAYPDQVFRNVPWAYIKMDIAFQLLAPPHRPRVLSGGGFAPAEMEAVAQHIRAIRPMPAYILKPWAARLFRRDEVFIDSNDEPGLFF